jgi:hypothetical protein
MRRDPLREAGRTASVRELLQLPVKLERQVIVIGQVS